MLKKLACAALVVGATVQPALAQQTLNFTLGYFTVKGEDARRGNRGEAGDVIAENREFLTFDVDEFNGPTVGGEWLVALGDYVEAGAGIGFSRRTVPSVYTRFLASDGTEIAQDLRLRLVPIALTVRVVPFGHGSPVQPYFGGGLGIFAWRYSESGDFINFNEPNRPVFRESFEADGVATGPIALGGLRFAGETMTAGAEIRYQSAEGDVGDDFAGPNIDLGGWSYLFTVGVRFGR